MNNETLESIRKFGQEHVLAFEKELSESERKNLLRQLEEIDWKDLDSQIKEYVLKKPDSGIPASLAPAPFLPASPKDDAQKKFYAKALETGRAAIRDGKVCALTVAGGQGTRLGYDGPKGTFPITPVKKKTLFQHFAESIRRLSEKYGGRLQWFIMTSEMNDSQTKKFFEDNKFFELDRDQVFFFTQGTMPSMGLDGKILLSSKSSLALAPNGHGGTLLALRKSGALDRMKKLGIEHISYFQVDNPLVTVADPLFLGLHMLEGSEASSKMLPKTGPYEKLGNFCVSDGRLMVIEYSDMPTELAEARNPDGSLKFLPGSPAIHMFSRAFVERLTENSTLSLPWHRADKKVSFVDSSGEKVSPEKPNAVKLESFVFDALPLAKKTLILEARREDQFAPTKNMTGVDSVESCRAMLADRDARRLEMAGVKVPRKPDGSFDAVVEISPVLIVDDEDAAAFAASKTTRPPERGEEYYLE